MQATIRPGCLYLVATPIGNLEDITLRALRVLKQVDLVAAEDTRSARALFSHFEIKTPRLVSFFKGNEAKRSQEILRELQQGRAVALITESGMPGISDPGSRLVRQCLAAEVEVDLVPGPNAALSALVLSGLPTERFTFVGFLPRRGAARRRILEQLVSEPGTMLVHEAPGRAAETLGDLRDLLGDRRAALARELTKLHQEVVRGNLTELTARCRAEAPRGELTIVVSGAEGQPVLSDDAIEGLVAARLQRGQSPRTIADALAAQGRRRVYQIAIRLKD